MAERPPHSVATATGEALSPQDCLAGGGEMGALMRSTDWSQTVFGPVAVWPQSLRTAISIMLESRFAMVVAWGPDFRFFYNDRYRPILGTKHPAALGTGAAEIFPEVWPAVGPAFEGVRRGEAFAIDDWLLPLERNGYLENCWFTLSYSPIRDETGGVGGLLAIVAETTGRVEGERRLATLRELARRAADATTSDQACVNAGRVFEANPIDVPFALVYLLEHDAAVARRVCATRIAPEHPASVEIVHLDTGANDVWHLGEVVRTGKTIVLSHLPESVGVLSGGPYEEQTHTAILLPLTRPGLEHPYGVLVAGVCPRRALDDRYRDFFELTADHIATGISNAVALEEVQRRADALAQIDRAKTAFFSNVSHEFRTPLTLMLGPTEAALGRSDRTLGADDLEMVHRNQLRLLKLVNTLLDYSRIEAGRAQAKYQRTDIAALTRELAGAFRSAIEHAGLDFDVACDPIAAPVYLDRDMWEKIVLNLLSNAFKFTLDGSIRIALTDEGGCVRLTVEDTGSGIPEAEVPRVFERFHRIEGTKSRTHEGSGIGLALTYELVHLHGGNISVSSRLGEGSVFTVQIPTGISHLPHERVDDAESQSVTALGAAPFVQEAARWQTPTPHPGSDAPGSVFAAAGTGSAATLAKRERILVVDDNADMRDYVSRLLSDWQVETAANGAVALEQVRLSPPDLIVSDVMMPELDGFGLLTALRGNPSTSNIPVILVSARAGEEATLEGVASGADDYLVKPFSARDLVARVEAQLNRAKEREALRQRTALIESVINNAPLGAYLVNQDFTIAHVNPIALPVFGDIPNLVGRDFAEVMQLLWAKDYADEVVRQFRQTLDTGQPYVTDERAEFRIDRGITEYYEWRIDRIALPGGGYGVVCYFRDISVQVKTRLALAASESQFRALAENLTEANRLKDEFLALLSHELRTPLNAILGWSHMLRSGALPSDTQRRALEAVDRNAKAQMQLVEDLLDVSRIISGKLTIKGDAVDVYTVIAGAIDSVRPSASAKGVSLNVGIDPESQILVTGDADRLQQVAWNLLSNAVKFTPEGGRVTVDVRASHSQAEIIVTDSGEGIDPAFLPHVFERFRQADSSPSRVHGGLGLGLSIVKHLVEAHGGTVLAESGGKGQGAMFVVRLPIRSVAQRGAPVRTPRGGSELRGVRAMVVDDELDARELVRFILEGEGARVTTAESAGVALRLFEPRSFDVLVADIGMPEEDGYSLIRAIRRLPAAGGRAIPAVAVTAYVSVWEREEALRAGYDRHLSKPIEPRQLIAAVLSVLNPRSTAVKRKAGKTKPKRARK